VTQRRRDFRRFAKGLPLAGQWASGAIPPVTLIVSSVE
jgi:hypothetical protein